MRFICVLFVSTALFSGTRCAAQTAVPPDQCPGGFLIGVQPDSITTKFNDKITTLHLAPGAEIWSRGADLTSTSQLVLGDEIYLRCTRAQTDTPVLAEIVAASERN